MDFNKRKFAELVLYISERTMDDPDFGTTKMAKALWLADFSSVQRWGRPMTGATYQKLQHGPAAREYKPVVDDLIAGGDAAEASQEIFNHPSKRLVALRPANKDLLHQDELSLVDSILDYCRKHTASELSELSHRFIGWKLADYREAIPYGMVLIPEEPLPLTDSEIDYGRRLADRLDGDS